ncbi:alpha/beta fold hydrolase [Nocardioides sp.]|uniref:alpha/beta fold hydrolase n=1 Tax=Nocardioides sp. TaxID=35761 RepID=UPI003526C55B
MDRVRVARIGEVDLFVRELGHENAGDPPLVVIHGGPDWDHSYLLPALKQVAQRRHVVAFDLRGCGRSSRGLSPERYQPELAVEDVSRLITWLNHEQVDVLGFSTGGQIAQLLVDAHPSQVRRVVLASTTAYGDFEQHLRGWAERDRRLAMPTRWPSWARFAQDSPRTDREQTIDWAVSGASTSIWTLDRLDEYLELLADVRFSGDWIGPFRTGRLHPWRPPDPAETLRRFDAPILVLHGAQDMSFPVEVAHRLHSDVPETQLVVVEDAGHMAHFDQTHQWATAVTTFLSS